MEAMTVNLSGTAPTFNDSPTQEYFEHYVPIRFRNALFKKLEHKHQGKRYWELPHVVGHPFVLALQDFHAPKFTSMFWSSSALVEYLYGIRQVERRTADDLVEIASERVDLYKWENREIPAGFFSQPETLL